MEKFTGVRFDRELGEFEAVVCGEVEGWGNTAREASAKLQECIAWRAAVASKAQAPVAVESRTTVAAVAVPVRVASAPRIATERAQVKCAWFRLIRAFYGAAQGRNLDTKNDEAIRAALARFVGRNIESRAELRAGEWNAAADAVRRGALAW
jgi:hypothetical protein